MVSTLIDFSTDRAVHEKERSSGFYFKKNIHNNNKKNNNYW